MPTVPEESRAPDRATLDARLSIAPRAHLLALQQARGCWEGEMVWCPVILAQHVIVQRVVGRAPDAATRAGILRHFEVTRTAGRSLGPSPRGAGERLRHDARLRRAPAAGRAAGRSACGDGARAGSTPSPGGVLRHPDVGQALAGAAGPLRLRRGQPLPARAVAPAPLAALSTRVATTATRATSISA